MNSNFNHCKSTFKIPSKCFSKPTVDVNPSTLSRDVCDGAKEEGVDETRPARRQSEKHAQVGEEAFVFLDTVEGQGFGKGIGRGLPSPLEFGERKGEKKDDLREGDDEYWKMCRSGYPLSWLKRRVYQVRLGVGQQGKGKLAGRIKYLICKSPSIYCCIKERGKTIGLVMGLCHDECACDVNNGPLERWYFFTYDGCVIRHAGPMASSKRASRRFERWNFRGEESA